MSLWRRHFQQQWQQYCFFNLHLIVATVEWNTAHFISPLKSARNWEGWRIRPGNMKAQSWIWIQLLVTCESQQSPRKPQAFQKCARSQCCLSWMERIFYDMFWVVTNHFPKKSNFCLKFLTLCSTSNKIFWYLGGNEGKVGRSKVETYKDVSHVSVSPWWR